MKKLLVASATLIAAFTIAGCSSTPSSYKTTLGQYTEDRLFINETFYGSSMDDTRLVNPKDYEVLGPVIVYEKDKNGITGYSEILSAAIEKYPETSAVINIVKDIEVFSDTERQTAWSGIAIKITDTIVGNETIQTTKSIDANGKEVLTETRTTTYKKL